MPKAFQLLPIVELPAADSERADDFAQWLQQAQRGEAAEVACGSCNACCKSSYFIHVEPSDTAALEVIPADLLFQAPSSPVGHRLMGLSADGHCPMLVDERCSIYKQRPKTCRTYDCRVFAAAGVDAGGEEKRGVNQQLADWTFRYQDAHARRLHEAVRTIVSLVLGNADQFPAGLWQNPSPLALFAIEHATALVALLQGARKPMTQSQVLTWLTSKLRGNVAPSADS